jgi:hypothetical protein
MARETLLILAVLLCWASGGCERSRKDVIPTKIEAAPKGQPGPIEARP